MRLIQGVLAGAVASLAIVAWPYLAAADPKPGDLITPANAQTVKDLVSPGVYYLIQRGMRMKIAPPTTIQLPPPYMEATEKYSGQVRLTPDRRASRAMWRAGHFRCSTSTTRTLRSSWRGTNTIFPLKPITTTFASSVAKA